MKDHSNADAIRGYSFLKIFADNDSLNADELAFIERLALEDRMVDEKEKAVLSAIFERAAQIGVTAAVANEIAAFKKRIGMD